jgi:hypothetical protein
MVDIQRELEPLRERLAAQGIENLICPPHPHLSNVRLRAGLDKRGNPAWFEPVQGREGPDAWRMIGPISRRKQKELQPHINVLVSRRGPSNCTLFYHEPKPGHQA